MFYSVPLVLQFKVKKIDSFNRAFIRTENNLSRSVPIIYVKYVSKIYDLIYVTGRLMRKKAVKKK
jgi:hypothetical protein